MPLHHVIKRCCVIVNSGWPPDSERSPGCDGRASWGRRQCCAWPPVPRSGFTGRRPGATVWRWVGVEYVPRHRTILSTRGVHCRRVACAAVRWGWRWRSGVRAAAFRAHDDARRRYGCSRCRLLGVVRTGVLFHVGSGRANESRYGVCAHFVTNASDAPSVTVKQSFHPSAAWETQPSG